MTHTTMKKMASPFELFTASHKDADLVRQCAMHYRTNVYGYIVDWCKRHSAKHPTEVATRLMAKYGFKFGEVA